MRRTRLVMLCDVSGSMDTFNPFLLRLMLGLQQLMRNSRTLVFSTHVTEITSALRTRSVIDALMCSSWSRLLNAGSKNDHMPWSAVKKGR